VIDYLLPIDVCSDRLITRYPIVADISAKRLSFPVHCHHFLYPFLCLVKVCTCLTILIPFMVGTESLLGLDDSTVILR
jgi:hypothetical protein